MAQREGKPRRAIHGDVSTLLKQGRCGYAPSESLDNSFCLMSGNFNSLGVFTGKSKPCRVNDLASKYKVDCLAGCKLQYEGRFAPEEDKFRTLFGVGK